MSIEYYNYFSQNTTITINYSLNINESNNNNTDFINNTNNDNNYTPSLIYVITVSIMLSSIDVITLVGNLLVVIAVLTTKSLSTVTNYFIMSLAVADMLVAIFVLPISIYTVIHAQKWIFGGTICNLWLISDVMLCTASILNLCCISLDRYFAITRPLQYSRQRSPKQARGMIAAVWIASIIISCPPLFGWRAKDEDEYKDTGPCTLNKLLSYRIYSSIGSFYLPALVMLFVYGRIFKVIHDREKYLMNSSEVTRKRYNIPKNVKLIRGISNNSESLTLGKQRKDSIISTSSNLKKSIPNFKQKFYLENSDLYNANTNITTKPFKYEMNTITEKHDENSFINENESSNRNNNDSTTTKCCYKICNKTNNINKNETYSNKLLNKNEENQQTELKNLTNKSVFNDKQNGTIIQKRQLFNSQHKLIKSSSNGQLNKSAYSSAPVLNADANFILPYNNLSKFETRKTNFNNTNRTKPKYQRNFSNDPTINNKINTNGVVSSNVNSNNDNNKNNKKKQNIGRSTPSNLYLYKSLPNSNSIHHFYNDSDCQLSNTFSNNSTSTTPTTQTTSRYQEQLRLLKESKAAKTLAIVVGGFIICWLPFFVVYVLEPICPKCKISIVFIDGITWLGYFNSAINPFIYAFYSKQFRSAFYRLTIGKCFKTKNNHKYYLTNNFISNNNNNNNRIA